MNTSSIILLVIDVNKRDNKIAHQIAEEVKGFIEVRGLEHLYILYNQWDKKARGTTLENLEAEFARKYNIDNATLKNRMFAVSALYAFTAIQFQQGPQNDKNPKLQKNAKELLEQLYPIDEKDDIETKLKNFKIEELREESNKLINKSLFPRFLENVIDSLIQEVVPRSMLSELLYSENCLEAFQQNIDAKLNFYNEKLRNNGKELRTKIEKMTELEKELENKKNQFLKDITETYSIVEITHCIEGLQSKVKKMEKTTTGCFQLQPGNFNEHRDKILHL